ncbi:MAG: hypothetical protein KGI52_13355, partial [Burkholderiales bacterium]|nr:hypothetical protein [Burkholderiales bacterium]
MFKSRSRLSRVSIQAKLNGKMQYKKGRQYGQVPVNDRVYFDITDVVHFAMSESRVTGIQRVQIRIVSNYAKLRPNDTYVAFQHPVTRVMVCTKAIGVFPGSEFDAVEFLY